MMLPTLRWMVSLVSQIFGVLIIQQQKLLSGLTFLNNKDRYMNFKHSKQPPSFHGITLYSTVIDLKGTKVKESNLLVQTEESLVCLLNSDDTCKKSVSNFQCEANKLGVDVTFSIKTENCIKVLLCFFEISK